MKFLQCAHSKMHQSIPECEKYFTYFFFFFQENQTREKQKLDKKKAEKHEERLKNKELIREGKAPV